MKKLLLTLLFLPLSLFAQDEDPCYSINDFISHTESENPFIIKNFVSGWNMFGYPCSQSIDLSEAFSSIVENVIIVKDNNGNVYMPEFSFNGIGFLEGGEGYQIKMNNTEYGFSFCEHITWPNIEGCTDCEANNFNQWANVDDGSCDYDSDGDGILDSEEVLGCQDSLACDYNINATDSADCYYAHEGYDCNGNIYAQLGDEAFGGVVFYVDETGERGLVSSYNDYLSLSFEWGCFNEDVLGADDTFIGSGYQNTINIVNQDCSTLNGNITAARAASDFDTLDYDDWYLPSKDELLEIFSKINQGILNGDMLGFESNEMYWSSSEYDNLSAAFIDFSNGNINYYAKWNTFKVRPIRAFGNWIMGCMDSLACNFNPDANLADGSCDYDSDDDGILDSEEVLGCQDSLACDYNINATDSADCYYAHEGYDCNGNIYAQLGDEAFGGVVFYVDETGEHGLVAAMEDLTEGATIDSEGNFGYQWGCFATWLSGADGQAIGTGHQNSLDIVAGCSETSIAASEALAYESEDYSDWYLPSLDELNEMYNVIGPGGSEGNIGGFSSNWYWSSSESNNYGAYDVNFSDGSTGNFSSKTKIVSVRPIRSF